MDDFLAYFLAGMFGEEFLRKIATRPYGVMYLWLIGFVIANVFFIILAGSFIVLGIFTDPAADPSILRYVFDSFTLIAVESQPGATLLALVMGLMFALGYRGHYRDKSKKLKSY